jgi:hypothetical protein
MTRDEAAANIGRLVVYRPLPDVMEEGVITSIGDYYVFVRYGTEQTSAGTPPEDLFFASAP